MIISHQYQFIYVAIPKTATHAVRQALRPNLADSDWEQVEHLKSSRFPIEDFQKLNHGHISLDEIKKYLKPQQFNEYFKFTMVRNPYDRFISYSFFRFKNNSLFEKNPTEAMKLLLRNPNHKSDILLKPQVEFLMDGKGNFLVDFIGRIESAQEAMNHINKSLGIPEVKLEVVNQSKHLNFIQYYDDELTQMVTEKYKVDFERLAYSKHLKPKDEQS